MRTSLRRQAPDWLRIDLALLAKEPAGDPKAGEALRHWQADPDLAPIREPAALAALPPVERATWAKLRADVDALLTRQATGP